jgi:hypothetical protein
MANAAKDYVEAVCEVMNRHETPFGSYRAPFNVLREYGREFEVAEGVTDPLLPQEGLQNKACFANAFYYGVGRYAYAEGIAIPAGLGVPMEHAWVVDRATGRAIEITWGRPGVAYFGVLVTRSALSEAKKTNGCMSVLFAWCGLDETSHYSRLVHGQIHPSEVFDYLEAA